jgi:hypothetical protein
VFLVATFKAPADLSAILQEVPTILASFIQERQADRRRSQQQGQTRKAPAQKAGAENFAHTASSGTEKPRLFRSLVDAPH